jgi:hypothetical protein
MGWLIHKGSTLMIQSPLNTTSSWGPSLVTRVFGGHFFGFKPWQHQRLLIHRNGEIENVHCFGGYLLCNRNLMLYINVPKENNFWAGCSHHSRSRAFWSSHLRAAICNRGAGTQWPMSCCTISFSMALFSFEGCFPDMLQNPASSSLNRTLLKKITKGNVSCD